MRLIDADALKEEVNKKKVVGRFNTLLLIDNMPAVEQEVYMHGEDYNFFIRGYKEGRKDFEPPKGEWNYIQAGMCVCPFCGATPHKEYKNFCAKCGADMRPQTHIRPKDEDDTWKEDMQRDADAYYESQNDDE